MLFGRKISKLWGLLRWVLTVGFRSAHRSQLQLLLCRRRLQDFSQTSSVCFACRRWYFPHHADRFEKNSFFNDLGFLGSALAWFGLCLEELRSCGFARARRPRRLSHETHLLSLLPPSSGQTPPHVRYPSVGCRPGLCGLLGLSWVTDTKLYSYRKQNV